MRSCANISIVRATNFLNQMETIVPSPRQAKSSQLNSVIEDRCAAHRQLFETVKNIVGAMGPGYKGVYKYCRRRMRVTLSLLIVE